MIELLVTLLIIATLASLAGPGFVDLIAANRQTSALGTTFGMLNSARSEAVSQATTVSACASSDQTTCDTNNWEAGWLIFVDDGAGVGGVADDGDINGSEQVLRVGQAAGGAITIRTINITDAGAISFDDDGMATDRGTIVLCTDRDIATASGIVLNFSGQARMLTDDDSDGTLNDDASNEVTVCP